MLSSVDGETTASEQHAQTNDPKNTGNPGNGSRYPGNGCRYPGNGHPLGFDD